MTDQQPAPVRAPLRPTLEFWEAVVDEMARDPLSKALCDRAQLAVMSRGQSEQLRRQDEELTYLRSLQQSEAVD